MLCEERGVDIGGKGGGDPKDHPATVAGCAAEVGVSERTARPRTAQANAYEALPKKQQKVIDKGEITLSKIVDEQRRERLISFGPQTACTVG